MTKQHGALMQQVEVLTSSARSPVRPLVLATLVRSSPAMDAAVSHVPHKRISAAFSGRLECDARRFSAES
jgi:hypothetical protein